MTPDLKQMPSYTGLHYTMLQKHFTPRTILKVEQQYAQVDINHLIEDDFDINNSILADEPMELELEQEYWNNKQIEEYQDAMQFAMEQTE
jgi:hypothetical protein